MKIIPVVLLLVLSSVFANASENNKIVNSLFRISGTKIPPKGLHCEINGTDSLGLYNDVTIGEILADFIHFTLEESSAKMYSFTCEGKDIKACVLRYGKEKNVNSLGWDLFLKFKYNEKNNHVIPESLECIQVP